MTLPRNPDLTSARWATALRLSAHIFSWLSTIIVIRFTVPDYSFNTMMESPPDIAFRCLLMPDKMLTMPSFNR